MNSVTVDEIYGIDAEIDQVARLPGEDADHAEGSEKQELPEGDNPDGLAAEPQARPRKSSRGNVALYASVGLVALLMAGSYSYLRPSTAPHPTQAAMAPVAPVAAPLPPPLAPAASLAKVPVPHLPAAIVHQKFVPQPAATQLSEIDALRSGGQGPAVPPSPGTTAPHKAIPPAPVSNSSSGLNPVQTASSTRPAAPMTPAALDGATVPKTVSTASGSPVSAAMVASQKPAGAMPPPAAVTLTAAQAGTLSAAQQTNLYQLVTQLGSLERNDEIRQAVLAGQVQQLMLLVSGKLADYDRRLSMLEAQTAVSGAVSAASNPTVSTAIAAAAPPPSSTPQGSSTTSPSEPSSAAPAALPSSAPAAPVQYQVQAASPGLAMLSAQGGGQPIEVQTGDTIPGYGKVLGVIQQGASWVVQTQSGDIQ